MSIKKGGDVEHGDEEELEEDDQEEFQEVLEEEVTLEALSHVVPYSLLGAWSQTPRSKSHRHLRSGPWLQPGPRNNKETFPRHGGRFLFLRRERPCTQSFAQVDFARP